MNHRTFNSALMPAFKIYFSVESQQTQNICTTFIQGQTNVFDVGPTLCKCYTNDLCLLGCLTIDLVFYEFSHDSLLKSGCSDAMVWYGHWWHPDQTDLLRAHRHYRRGGGAGGGDPEDHT